MQWLQWEEAPKTFCCKATCAGSTVVHCSGSFVVSEQFCQKPWFLSKNMCGLHAIFARTTQMISWLHMCHHRLTQAQTRKLMFSQKRAMELMKCIVEGSQITFGAAHQHWEVLSCSQCSKSHGVGAHTSCMTCS